MRHLNHGDTYTVNDIWKYTISVWKDDWCRHYINSNDCTHYVMAKNATFDCGRFSVRDGNFAAQTTRGYNAEIWDVDSTVVDIEFHGLSMNDERVFVPDGLPTGNLSYMDGGTNTTAINPGRLGLPVINYVHFPKGMKQTLHTHPSQRIGLILSGKGTIELDDNVMFDIEEGDVFVMERNTLHNFMCDKGEDVTLFVFAPDSGTGPTDEINPLKVRTYVGQQRV